MGLFAWSQNRTIDCLLGTSVRTTRPYHRCMKRSTPLHVNCTMDTHSLLPLAGVLVAAAITPGPNNFIVMEAGARGGLVSAGRVALGVILGSVLLLAVILAGVGRALEQSPRFGAVLSLAGGTYLAWLGASLFLRAKAPRASAASRA